MIVRPPRKKPKKTQNQLFVERLHPKWVYASPHFPHICCVCRGHIEPEARCLCIAKKLAIKKVSKTVVTDLFLCHSCSIGDVTIMYRRIKESLKLVRKGLEPVGRPVECGKDQQTAQS